jgi:S1-C subfamily serine protease
MMAPEVLQYKLGVYLVPTYFQDPVYGGVSGMYVNTVYANQPAHLASVEVGDVIVRVNGRPVRSYAEYNNAINASGGYASLRVRDVRTGGYLTTQPLQLIPSYPQYGPGDGYGP